MNLALCTEVERGGRPAHGEKDEGGRVPLQPPPVASSVEPSWETEEMNVLVGDAMEIRWIFLMNLEARLQLTRKEIKYMFVLP
jgi:hypothetical protein